MGSTPQRGVMYPLYDGFYLFVKGAKLVHNNAMTAPSGVLLWLKNVTKDDVHTAGEKAVHLADLIQAKFPLPDGFVITSLAYFHFLNENKLIPKINQLLQTVNYEHPESVMQVASHIQKLIQTTKILDTFTAEVSRAYHQLCGSFTNAPVSISLPHETIHNVHGEANILQKIKQAWTTLFTPEALIYRHNRHVNHFQEGIAVVIQKEVADETAGVLLTSDPITHDRSKLIIEVIDGVTDHYVVDKTTESHRIIEKNIAGTNQKISDERILALSELGKTLEKHCYFPQEVHWAIERDTLYIVGTKQLDLHQSMANISPLAEKLPLLLKGIPASTGIATGVVKLILQTKDYEHIAHGDIVVASEIAAEYKHFLKKAAGFIIDHGGRTSPIAILAREWGIPAVVGTTYGAKNVKNGQIITIDGAKGEIYRGSPASHSVSKHKTHLFEFRSDAMPPFNDFSDGALLIQKPTEQPSASLFLTVCGEFDLRPVIYRLSDGVSEGANPLIGSHGTHHLLHHPELLRQEFKILQEAKGDPKCRNLAILLPFVRNIQEIISFKTMLNEYGLTRSDTKLWIEAATPSTLMQIAEYHAVGIDGVVLDTDTLAMLMLGTDKNDSAVAHAFDPTNKAMLQLLENAIKSVHANRLPLVIYGHTLSHHTSLIEKTITWGVTAVAVEPDHIDQTRKNIIEMEQRLIENH